MLSSIYRWISLFYSHPTTYIERTVTLSNLFMSWFYLIFLILVLFASIFVVLFFFLDVLFWVQFLVLSSNILCIKAHAQHPMEKKVFLRCMYNVHLVVTCVFGTIFNLFSRSQDIRQLTLSQANNATRTQTTTNDNKRGSKRNRKSAYLKLSITLIR